MQLCENAHRVLEARYLRRDAEGKVSETPEQRFARVARAIAHAELLPGNREQSALWEERFYQLMTSLDFLPNSPTLMNAGTPLGQLSACFVLPIEESMESIFAALRDMALVPCSGGDTGFSFGMLRPEGDLFATALEIAPRQHLLIQAAFQSSVDNAVSKTINLPTEATSELVAEIYRQAYHLGLKGITIYRYGSVTEQVLQLGAGEEPYEKEHASKCDPYQCKL